MAGISTTYNGVPALWLLLLLLLGVTLASRPFLNLVKPSRKLLNPRVPLSVNYHFTRQCNKTCGFCFHTALTSHKESPQNAKRGLRLLAEAGMKKINFAGGEPFLYKKFLGTMLQFCKEELHLESCSIVTNGSLVDEKFLQQYGRFIDILAVSCDSFDEATNIAIGRGSGNNVAKLFEIATWCKQHGIKFKLNTVVNRLNYAEDMRDMVRQLAPFRWKCFQVLMVAGENDSEATLRDVRKFQISDEEFEMFCEKHRDVEGFVEEGNRVMKSSYLILDEYMRFLDREGKEPSGSVLEVGVQRALEQVTWDKESFVERGGIYDWTRDAAEAGGDAGGCASKVADDKKLDW